MEEQKDNRDILKILETARSMSSVINMLLHKTLDDSIAMTRPVNLNSLLKQELAFCAHDLYFKHNIQLVMNLDANISDIYLVYGDISQVFQTIFNNAIDAMMGRKERILTVTSFISEKIIGFSVKDTGVGIPDSIINNIFDLSFTTKKQTDSSGFGIGLPLAKNIIDKLGGTIEVSSQEGVGTEFVVKLIIENVMTSYINMFNDTENDRLPPPANICIEENETSLENDKKESNGK